MGKNRNNKPLKDNLEIEEKKDIQEEVVDTVDEPVEELFGLICDCGKLRIRKEPNTNADILCELPVGTKLDMGTEILVENNFYKVSTSSGVIGWAMKKFVAPI